MTTPDPSTAHHTDDAVPDAQNAVVCPYCGHAQPSDEVCERCNGIFEPLSRQASQNSMGPWFIRDEQNPFLPGCSHQTLARLIQRRRITPETIIRGPTTRQFWAFARDSPGVAHLLGECHNCHGPADADEYMCRACGAVFVAPSDRQTLGLSAIRRIPGQLTPSVTPSIPVSTSNEVATDPAPVAITSPSEPSPSASSTRAPSQKAVRRLRRELANWKLAALLLAFLTIALIVTIAGLVAQLRTTSSTPAHTGPAPADVAPASEPAKTSEPTPAPEPAEADTREAARAEVRSRVSEALALAASGAEADLRAALAGLAAIQSDTPPDLWPADLLDHVETLERRLDDLYFSRYLDNQD